MMVELKQSLDKIQKHSVERAAEYHRLVSELLELVTGPNPTTEEIVTTIRTSLERTVSINNRFLATKLND